MSALRKRRESPQELIAAAKSKPLEGEEYEKYLAKLPSREERKAPWGHYKGAFTLPADNHTRGGRKIYSPQEWRYVGIELEGKRFRLVMAITRIEITAANLEQLKINPELTLSKLTLPQALSTGEVIENALQRLLAKAT